MYEYVHSSPLVLIDPTGLYSVKQTYVDKNPFQDKTLPFTQKVDMPDVVIEVDADVTDVQCQIKIVSNGVTSGTTSATQGASTAIDAGGGGAGVNIGNSVSKMITFEYSIKEHDEECVICTYSAPPKYQNLLGSWQSEMNSLNLPPRKKKTKAVDLNKKAIVTSSKEVHVGVGVQTGSQSTLWTKQIATLNFESKCDCKCCNK